MKLADIPKSRGKGAGVGMTRIEQGAIERFADAVGDNNPLFRDSEYARKSRHGAIITIPGFFGWSISKPKPASSDDSPEPSGPALSPADQAKVNDIGLSYNPELGKALVDAGYTRLLDGGMEYEFYLPIRAGDVLSSSGGLKDITEREGGTGKMALVRNETTYYNQNGDCVATAIGTSIYR